jgi:hypothetical protein
VGIALAVIQHFIISHVLNYKFAIFHQITLHKDMLIPKTFAGPFALNIGEKRLRIRVLRHVENDHDLMTLQQVEDIAQK